MRKTIFAIAALLVLLLCSACPARSEVVLTTEIEDAEDYVLRGLISDDSAVVFGLLNIYVWRPGEEKMTVYIRENLAEDLPSAAFKRNGDVWTLSYRVLENGIPAIAASRVQFNDNKTYSIAEKKDILPPAGEVSQGGSVSILAAVPAGDSLYILVNIDNDSTQLWRTGSDGGETRIIRDDCLGQHLFAAPDNRLLVECMDREKGTAWYELYDPQTGEFAAHGGIFEYDRMKDGMVGAAWDAEHDCLYYQENEQVKCAEEMDPNRAVQVASLIRPSERATEAAGLIKGKYYTYMTNGCPAVIDLEESRNRTNVFKVSMPELNDAVVESLAAIEARHPDVMAAVDSQYYSDAELSNHLNSQNDDIDIFIIPSNGISALSLALKEYLDPIRSAAVAEAVSKMYPTVRAYLEIDGKAAAVPVEVEGDTMGINRVVLEQLEGPGAELPTDFVKLLEKLKEINEKCGDHTDYSVFPLWLSPDAVRSHLLQYVLIIYCKAIDENPDIGYDTPELRNALQAIMDLDLEEMGLGEYTSSDINNIKTIALIKDAASTVCEKLDEQNTAQPLAVFPDTQPILPVDMSVAIINPNSKNKELSEEFFEELIKHYDDTTKYTLSAEYNSPIPDPLISNKLKKEKEERDKLKQMLENSEGIQKEELENRLSELESTIELLEILQWKLDTESIEHFRENADKMYITTYNYAVTGDAAELAVQLLKGTMPVERYVKELDKRTKMLIKEGF